MRQNISDSLRLFGTAALFGSVLSAGAISPYTVDSNTLHLWHLDEGPAGTLPKISATEEVNSSSYALNVTNGASLMAPSYNTALDGALDTSGDADDVALNESIYYLDEKLTGNDGAFTYEALVCPFADLSGTIDGRSSAMEMICFDSEADSTTNRFFPVPAHFAGHDERSLVTAVCQYRFICSAGRNQCF